jgi:hypothetical protein
MLEVLESAGTIERAAARLSKEYDRGLEELIADVRQFVQDLQLRGLVELGHVP